jgi:hypothetical protein
MHDITPVLHGWCLPAWPAGQPNRHGCQAAYFQAPQEPWQLRVMSAATDNVL